MGFAMAGLKKTETINLRVDLTTRDLIARAAEATGKSMTAFMTEAAQAAAEQQLLDRRFINLDAAAFDALEALLDGPATANAALTDLLRSPRG